MNHSFIDEHSHIDSFLNRLDARTKIISFFTLILFIILSRPDAYFGFALYTLLLIILIIFSQIPLSYILKRCLVVLPFILMTSALLPFGQQGESIVLMKVGDMSIRVAAAGWLIFKGVLIKGVLSIICLTLLTASTPFSELLAALEALKCPKIITMILSFMYRYVFLIEDEAMKMRRAMKSRSAGHSRWLQLKAIANMIGVLFIRSYERGETVYLAMCSRGFDGTIKRDHSFDFKKTDYAFATNLFVILIGIKFLDNIFGR